LPEIRRRESSRRRADDRRPRADHLLQPVGREGLRLGSEGAPRAARQRLLQGRDGRGAGAHAAAPRRDACSGLPDDVPEEGGRLGPDRHLRGARTRRPRRSRRNRRHRGGRGSLSVLTSPCFGPTVTRTMGRLAMRRRRVTATRGTLLLLTALATMYAATEPLMHRVL